MICSVCLSDKHRASNCPQRVGRFLGLAMLILALLTLQPALAHDWYPLECCHAQDCAPVDSVQFVAGATYRQGNEEIQVPGYMVVTTKHGTVGVPADFPRRESKDNRMHACMTKLLEGKDGMRILCLFIPPSS